MLTVESKIAISGASGFVGLHLLNEVAASVDRVVAIHNRPLPASVARKYGESVSWLRADIVCDDLHMAMREVDIVFHLAAYYSGSEAPEEVSQMERVNCLGTARLAAAAKQAGARHFIFVSSIAACETAATADIDESVGLPRSSYGRSKRAAEDSILALSGPEFAVTILRPTALFGEDHLGSVYELVRVVNDRRFFIFGSGRNRTNFYYVRDFVAAMITVADDVKAFGQVFIASDRAYSLQEIVDGIAIALGCNYRIRHMPRAVGLAIATICDVIAAVIHRPLPLSRRRITAMTRDVAYHNEKLARVLGVTPNVGVLEGLRRSIAWYRQAGLL